MNRAASKNIALPETMARTRYKDGQDGKEGRRDRGHQSHTNHAGEGSHARSSGWLSRRGSSFTRMRRLCCITRGLAPEAPIGHVAFLGFTSSLHGYAGRTSSRPNSIIQYASGRCSVTRRSGLFNPFGSASAVVSCRLHQRAKAAGYADFDSANTPPEVQHIGLTAALQSAELIERDGSKILDRTSNASGQSPLCPTVTKTAHLSQPVMWLRSRADPCDRRLSMAMAT